MTDTRRGAPLTSSRAEEIFATLTPAQIRRIAAHGHMRAIQRGEVLVEQGDSAGPSFVVVSGELEKPVCRESLPSATCVAAASSASRPRWAKDQSRSPSFIPSSRNRKQSAPHRDRRNDDAP
jgi:hypothetical protein